MKLALLVTLAVVGSAMVVGSAPSRTATTTTFRIVSVTGQVQASRSGYPPDLLVLTARVCFGSPAEAANAVPSRETVAQYQITKGGSWQQRAETTLTPPGWLVSFSENWSRTAACGPASASSPIAGSLLEGAAYCVGYGARLTWTVAGHTSTAKTRIVSNSALCRRIRD